MLCFLPSCLNDMMQSVIPAVYLILKEPYKLDFGQNRPDHVFQSMRRARAGSGWWGCSTMPIRFRFRCRLAWRFTLSGWCCCRVAPSYGDCAASAVALVLMGFIVFHTPNVRASLVWPRADGMAVCAFAVPGGGQLRPRLA